MLYNVSVVFIKNVFLSTLNKNKIVVIQCVHAGKLLRNRVSRKDTSDRIERITDRLNEISLEHSELARELH